MRTRSMRLSSIELFQMVKEKLGEKEAKSLVDFIESKVENTFEEQESFFASREDVLRVETQIREEILKVESRMKEEILKVETRLREEVIKVETRLREEVIKVETRLREEILKVQNKIIIWVIATMVALLSLFKILNF